MGGDEVDVKTLEAVRSVVFKESETLEDKNLTKINGYDFSNGVNLMGLLPSMVSTGFQASKLGDAIGVVNQMFDWKLSREELLEDCSEEEKDPSFRESVRCKIFLGFTSNLIYSRVRDIIQFLVQHWMVHSDATIAFPLLVAATFAYIKLMILASELV